MIRPLRLNAIFFFCLGICHLQNGHVVNAAEEDVPSYQLFLTPGEAHPDYTQIVDWIIARGIGAKSTLQFSNGAEIRNARLLAVGNSSVFFRISRHKLIRIARFQGLRFEGSHQDQLNSFLDGYELLDRLQIPVVRVFPKLSRRNEYVVEEYLLPDPRVGKLFSLSEYESGAVTLKPALRNELDLSLIEFAAKTYKIARFGDQDGSQVLLTSRGWVLADFSSRHVLAEPIKENTAIPFGLRYPSGEFPITQACALSLDLASKHPLRGLKAKSRSEAHALPVPQALFPRIRELILERRKSASH